MRVIAIKVGFFGGSRKRIGTEFELPDSAVKNGKLPSWVVEYTAENKAKLEDGKRFEAKRAREAAEAAAGPKRSRRGFAVVEGAEDLV